MLYWRHLVLARTTILFVFLGIIFFTNVDLANAQQRVIDKSSMKFGGLHPSNKINADCNLLLGKNYKFQTYQVMDWRDTVLIEQCDRIKKLQQLSELQFNSTPPAMYDGFISANRLPEFFKNDMPVLRVVFPSSVFFDTDSAQIREEAIPILDIIAKELNYEPPDVAMFVAGHADKHGDRNYNMQLSQRRASQVASAIAERTNTLASVWQIGFGEDFPLVDGETNEELGPNRRVEFIFAPRPEVVGVWLADAQVDMICGQADSNNFIKCKQHSHLLENYEGQEVKASSERHIVAPKFNAKTKKPNSVKTKPISNNISKNNISVVQTAKDIEKIDVNKTTIRTSEVRKIIINPNVRRAVIYANNK